jgi:hypothetical protein
MQVESHFPPRHQDSWSSEETSARVDSAVEISPNTDEGYRERVPLLVPPITGHGVHVHQTVPAWLGSLIIVGVLAWTTACAWCVRRLVLGGER